MCNIEQFCGAVMSQSTPSNEKERTHPQTNILCPLPYLRRNRWEGLHLVFRWLAFRTSLSQEAFRY
jgi:hypothetical protein